jgi:hypothetical protein
VKTWELAIESSDLNTRRWGKPIDGTEKHAGALSGKRDRSGCVCLGLEWILDGSDQDGVFNNRNHHASRCEISDDFLARLIGRVLSEGPRIVGKTEDDGDTCEKYEREYSV